MATNGFACQRAKAAAPVNQPTTGIVHEECEGKNDGD